MSPKNPQKSSKCQLKDPKDWRQLSLALAIIMLFNNYQKNTGEAAAKKKQN